MICLADDSGLEIDSLNRLPGIYSARWGGKKNNFDLAIKKIYSEMNLKKRSRVLWPTLHSTNKLGMGNNLTAILKGKTGLQNSPITQCYYPGHNTLEHHATIGAAQYHQGTMRQFHILEKLYDK